jgi:capsular polysaccharide biosynthesis protein
VIALLLFASISGIGFYLADQIWQPVYRAEATIFVPPDGGEMTSDSDQDAYTTFVNQQIMIILHHRTLSEAVQRLREKGFYGKTNAVDEREALDHLRKSLDVERIPNSYEVAIDVTAGHARDAALAANTIAQAFLDQVSQPDSAGHVDRATYLKIEEAGLTKELNSLLADSGKVSAALQVTDLGKVKDLPGDESMIELRKAADEAHRKRLEAEVALNEGQKTARLDAYRIVYQDPASRAVIATLLQRRSDLVQATKGMLPSHPVRQSAERQLASIDLQLQQASDDAISKLAANTISKLRGNLAECRRNEENLNNEVRMATARIPVFAQNLGRIEYIKAEISRIENRLSGIHGEREALALRRASGDSIRIFSAAAPPKSATNSPAVIAIVTSLLLAFVVSVVIPVAIDSFDNRIYGPTVVESLLGFPVLGLSLKPSSETSQFAAEHLRKLVAGIERGIAGGASTILLTGLKEPVSPALISEIWRLLSSHGLQVTVRAGAPGMAAEFRERTGAPKLLAAGDSDVEQIKAREVLIMDAPALLFSAGAERLASEAEVTLMVVQACKNTRTDLLRAAQILQRINVPAVGVILDNVQIKLAGYLLRRDFEEYVPIQSQMAKFLYHRDKTVN